MVIFVAISLLLVSNIPPINAGKGIGFGKGLDYGIDFAGGIQIWLKLEKPLNSDEMAVEKGILENRLNALGLKDVPVRISGDQYILLEVTNASPEEMLRVEDILKKQARFEARVDGELAMDGSEISVDMTSQGSSASRDMPSEWFVRIHNSKAGGDRFCTVAGNKRGRPIDMFLDRPENTTILMTNGTYAILSELEDDYEDSYIRVIENRSLIPVLRTDNDTLNFSKFSVLRGYHKVIIAANEDQISNAIRNELEGMNFTTERKPKGDESYKDWIYDMIGLESSPKLNCDPCRECKYDAIITGSEDTFEESKREIKRTKILLTSGNLPAKAEIESKTTTPPSLGEKFLKYSFLTGIIAIFTVAIVIFLRYRKLFIVVPAIITGMSEIIIILGMAALINWEIDLPAIAGIIAAVGTGVDDQIIITDETIKRKTERKVISLVERIKRAFFIIFTAAATTIAVMLPLMSIEAGMLKGFAFTTILGVLIGVFITRPAYAKIFEEILKR